MNTLMIDKVKTRWVFDMPDALTNASEIRIPAANSRRYFRAGDEDLQTRDADFRVYRRMRSTIGGMPIYVEG